MITTIVDQLRFWLIEMLLARFHGPRTVNCPGDGATALVQVTAFRSAVGRMHDDRTLRLSCCSRWPEQAGCAQRCASQLTKWPGFITSLPR